jgi:hypothetical protein
LATERLTECIAGDRGCGGAERNVKANALWTAVAGVAMATAAGCGGQDDLEATTAPTLAGDLVMGGVELRQGALSGGGGAAAPKVFYLHYADGNPVPSNGPDACAGKGPPPPFACTFAPTPIECQQQIQAYLDAWYANLNIIFTFTRPTQGSYYTEVVSSGGGAWCGAGDRVAGVSPFQCRDLQGGVAYTFIGGHSAKETAIIIAQEQAHLLGLEHTLSEQDLMHATICDDCNGFLDADTPTDTDRCDRATQNSYEMMEQQLGDWPGGPKPSPFGCSANDGAPYLKIMTPPDGAAVSPDFTVSLDARDDCALANVKVLVMPMGLAAESTGPPYAWDLTSISGRQTITVTALDSAGHTASAIVTVDAPVAGSGAPAGMSEAAGCSVASGKLTGSAILHALAMLLLLLRRSRPVSCGRGARALRPDSSSKR